MCSISIWKVPIYILKNSKKPFNTMCTASPTSKCTRKRDNSNTTICQLPWRGFESWSSTVLDIKTCYKKKKKNRILSISSWNMPMLDIYQELGSAPKTVTFICLVKSNWHISQNPTIGFCVTSVFETAPAPDLGSRSDLDLSQKLNDFSLM